MAGLGKNLVVQLALLCCVSLVACSRFEAREQGGGEASRRAPAIRLPLLRAAVPREKVKPGKGRGRAFLPLFISDGSRRFPDRSRISRWIINPREAC